MEWEILVRKKIISDNLINANTIFSIDLDNDGDNDILAAGGNAFDGEIVWFENLDGLGTFGNKKNISTEVQFPRSVIAADLDNDGDMDVIASSQNDNKIAWYENLTILMMDKNQVPSFLIYPNPVKNILNIETQTARDIKSTTLYDTYGRTLFKIDKGVSQIDFSNYATGIYFLKLSTSKGEQVFKVVRE